MTSSKAQVCFQNGNKEKECTDEDDNVGSSSGVLKSSVGLSLSKNWSKVESLFRQVLAKYLRLIATPAGQDSILKVAQYSLWMLSRFYLQPLLPVGHRRRNSQDGSSSMSITALENIAKSLVALSGEISWARYILRFFGLPPSIDGAYTCTWGMTGMKAIDDDICFNNITNNTNQDNDNKKLGMLQSLSSLFDGVVTSKRLGRVLAWTMIGYFPFEHAAYLQWKAPNLHLGTIFGGGGGRWRRKMITSGSRPIGNPDDVCPVEKQITNYASKFSAWSCRFWLAFIVLDIIKAGRALRRIQLLEQEKDKQKEHNDGTENTKGELPSPEELQKVAKGQKYAIGRDLLYILPAIGWSLPKWDTQPLLSDAAMNGFCWLEALVGFYQHVQATP